MRVYAKKSRTLHAKIPIRDFFEYIYIILNVLLILLKMLSVYSVKIKKENHEAIFSLYNKT